MTIRQLAEQYIAKPGRQLTADEINLLRDFVAYVEDERQADDLERYADEIPERDYYEGDSPDF